MDIISPLGKSFQPSKSFPGRGRIYQIFLRSLEKIALTVFFCGGPMSFFLRAEWLKKKIGLF
jgi:hypothetical protein